jgi:hypothetical protein
MLPSLHKRRVEGVVVPARRSRRLILLKPGCPPNDLTLRYRIFGHVMSVRLHPKPTNLHC